MMRKMYALMLCCLGAAQGAFGFQVTSTWLSADSGSWSDASHWSTSPDYPHNQTPIGTTYQALINAAGGVYTIEFDAGSISLANLNMIAPLATVNQSTGTLWLDSGTVSAGTYQLNGGMLGGAGNIDVYSSMVYNGGQLAGTGSLNIHAGGSLTIGSNLSRIVSRTIANSGTVNFQSFSSITLADGTFLNSGWTNFNNVSSPIQLGGSGGNNLINNTGTFNINASTTNFQLNASYSNSGTINVQAGTAQFSFGTYTHNAGTRFTGNGTLIASAGTMIFSGASTFSTSKVLLNGSYLTGPGSITNNTSLQWNAGSIDGGGRFINNATLTIGTLSTRVLGRMLVNNGTMNFIDNSGLTLSNGTIVNNAWVNLGVAITPFSPGIGSNNLVNNAGTLNINALNNTLQFYGVNYRNSGTINVQSGTLMYSFGTFTHEDGTRFTGAGTMISNSGSLQFNGDATFSIAHARLDGGSFLGAGDLYLESTFDFNGGSLGGGGTAWNTGTLNIGTYSTRYLARTLSNTGVVNFLPGTSLLLNSGTFDNLNVVNFTSVGSPFSVNGGTNNLVRNSGTFNINAATTVFNLSSSFVNSGTINIQAGTVQFGFGSYTMNAGTRFVGDGTVFASSGTFNFTGASTFSNARTILNGGFLRTSDVLTLASATDWNAGAITGSGSINNTGTLSIGNLATRILSNTLVNNATMTFATGAQVLLYNGTFINNGYVQLPTNSGFVQTGGTLSFLSNAGTLDLSLATFDTGSLSTAYTNSGTINVQAGTLSYNSFNTYLHDPGSRITGAGNLGLNAGTLFFFGDATISTAQTLFTGSRIDGTGTLHLHTGANWSNGTMAGSGTTTIEPGGYLNIVPGGNAVLSRYLVNNGKTTLQPGGVLVLSNGTFVNASNGTLFVNANPNFIASPTGLVRNDGTVVVANADVTIGAPFVNNGTVVVGSNPSPGPSINASQLNLTNLPQLNSGILEGGSWVINNDSQLTLPANVVENHATITLSGNTSTLPQLTTLQANSGSLILGSGQIFSTAGNLSNTGLVRILTGGQLKVAGNLTGSGTVQVQGQLTLNSDHGVSQIDHLSVVGGSADAKSSDLIVKGNPATISALVISGYNSGFWDGPGIRSSTAFEAQQTLGSALASDLFSSFPATYRGVSVDADSFIIAYTFAGDSNLDGKVNTIDFNNLAGSFGATGEKWVNGDSDYNGTVDSIDFNQLVSNFGRSTAPAPSLGALVPEPSTLSCGVALATLFAARRRRIE